MWGSAVLLEVLRSAFRTIDSRKFPTTNIMHFRIGENADLALHEIPTRKCMLSKTRDGEGLLGLVQGSEALQRWEQSSGTGILAECVVLICSRSTTEHRAAWNSRAFELC